MKNLFEIDSNEIKRILSLHENNKKITSKKLISEEDNKDVVPQFVTSKVNQLNSGSDIVAIDKNTKFTLKMYKGSKMANATNVTKVNPKTFKKIGTISSLSYSCKQDKYFVSGDDSSFNEFAYEKSLTQNLKKQICNKEIKKGNELILSKNFTFGNLAWYVTAKDVFTKTNDGAKFNVYKQGGGYQVGNFNMPISVPGLFKCSDSKFYINGTGYDEDNGKSLTNTLRSKFCQGKPQTQQQQQQNSTYKFDVLHTIGNPHNLGNVQISNGDAIIKSMKYPDYAAILSKTTGKAIAYYNCKTNTWGNVETTDSKGDLTGTIKEKVCPKVLTPTDNQVQGGTETQVQGGTETQVQGGTGTQPIVQQQGGVKTKSQEFIVNTTSGINKVQTLMNVPQTGQMDTTLIDNLITKLKK